MRGLRKNINLMDNIRFFCDDLLDMLNAHHWDRDYFMGSKETQYACGMCLIQIGEMVSRLDDDFKLEHPEVPWQSVKNTRNLYAHEYGKVVIGDFWETLTRDVPELRKQLDALITELEGPSDANDTERSS